MKKMKTKKIGLAASRIAIIGNCMLRRSKHSTIEVVALKEEKEEEEEDEEEEEEEEEEEKEEEEEDEEEDEEEEEEESLYSCLSFMGLKPSRQKKYRSGT